MSTEKHWATKQTVKQDEVRDFVAQGIDKALKHKREVGIGAAVVAVVAVAGGLFAYSRQAAENDAWEKLSMAEAYSYYGKAPEAQTAIAEAASQSASPAAAGLAGMMDGELKQAAGKPDEAAAAFAKAAQTSTPELAPFALADQVLALEAAGKAAECAASAQSFLDARADHFLAPLVHETMGRCQMRAGNLSAAKATWQKIALQYPDTPWAARANAQLQQATK